MDQIRLFSNGLLRQVVITHAKNLQVLRPNRLDIRFNFVNDMVTHKISERKVFPYEGNGFKAIELALVRGCAC